MISVQDFAFRRSLHLALQSTARNNINSYGTQLKTRIHLPGRRQMYSGFTMAKPLLSQRFVLQRIRWQSPVLPPAPSDQGGKGPRSSLEGFPDPLQAEMPSAARRSKGGWQSYSGGSSSQGDKGKIHSHQGAGIVCENRDEERSILLKVQENNKGSRYG